MYKKIIIFTDGNIIENNYVPDGLKFVLPFAVENHLDVDLELEGCVSVGLNAKVYSKIDNNYFESNSICDTYLFLTNKLNIIENIVSLEKNPNFNILNDPKTISFDIKKDSEEINKNEITINVINYNSNHLGVISKSMFPEKDLFDPFKKNQDYNVATYLNNDLVYEFLDINVCQFTAIYNTALATYDNTGLENKYGKVLAPNCYIVPSVKYFKEGPSDNEVQIPIFNFETFDELTFGNELFVIRFGYYRNESFEYDSAIWGQIVDNPLSLYRIFNIN